MKQDLISCIKECAKDVYKEPIEVELSRPPEQFGDYATNIALKLSSLARKNPKDLASDLAKQLSTMKPELIAKAEAAGGFINIRLTNEALLDLAESDLTQPFNNKSVVVEYSDANPFKILHAGHLYTSVVGDSIANLLSKAGGDVHRVNFGGDVGMHVAKSMWAIIKELGGHNPEELGKIPEEKRSEWMSERYVEGNKAFEASENIKAEIIRLNEEIYAVVTNEDKNSPLAKIYWTCRQWSYDYFDQFYDTLGIKFEKYYPESSVFKLGLETVRKHTPGVYEESDGAVVFKGEKYGLFTNVFINSQGLPTYSAKDVGLIIQKWQDYHFDKSVIITSNEQRDYMRVVLKSVEQFEPDLVKATDHLTHGEVKLSGGVKMSSRLGNFLKATDIIDAAKKANTKGSEDNEITIGAVKYSFLKQAIGPDIIYDAKESVSLEGNSGPYLQYALVRATNIIKKSGSASSSKEGIMDLNEDERSLLLKISEYNEVIENALNEMKPHYVCTFLYELAQKFNFFYEKNRVIGDQREALRLKLVNLYIEKLRDGLGVLGIPTPDNM